VTPSAPSYSFVGWTGGDERTLYAFVDSYPGARTITVRPGGGDSPKPICRLEHCSVRVATRAEAELHWQRPLEAGWTVDEGDADVR
jgi:hypothetical protein